MAIEEIRGRRNRYSGNTTTMSKHGVNGGGQRIAKLKAQTSENQIKIKIK